MTDHHKALTEKLPEEAIERALASVTRKGYDTTGYQYQYVADRLNEVFGIFGWTDEYEIAHEATGTWGQANKPFHDITVNMTLTVMDGDKVAVRRAPGGHKADSHADALKGAVTNAFKKTAALFGVGADAYRGVIDEDYRAQESQGAQTTQPTKKQEPLTAKKFDERAGAIADGAQTACPICGGAMWDNRAKKLNGEFKPNAPDFNCKDKSCGGKVWPKKDEPKTVAVEEFDPTLNYDEIPF